jgi:hypothetical protein
MRRRTRDLRLAVGLTTVAMALGLASSAGADTSAPVWTCRASLAYIDLNGQQRIEPIVANGNPNDIANPDRAQCVDDDEGVPFIQLPPGGSASGEIDLQLPYAKTTIDPDLANARDQKAHSEAGAASAHIVSGGTVQIGVDAIQAHADGSCVGGKPKLTGGSLVAGLTLGGMQIPIPDPSAPTVIDASPLFKISLNQEIKTGTADTADQSLVERAVQVEVGPGNPDAINIVAGEAKVDGHNFVCAPPVPPPTCPAGTTTVSTSPLVCQNTVTNTVFAPCPSGSTANAQGACIPNPQPCPSGFSKDSSGNCVQNPPTCPEGSTAQPNGVCLAQPTTGSSTAPTPVLVNGTNGGCGHLKMFFNANRRSALEVRYGHRQVIRGRIVSCDGKSIVRAKVDVYHIINGRKVRLIKTGLRSRPVGRLTLILPLNMTTRTLIFEYRPDLNSPRVGSRQILHLTVRNRFGKILRGPGPGSGKAKF